MSTTTFTLPGVTSSLQTRLAAGLQQVEETLSARLDNDDAFISEAAHHLAAAGGKRTSA